MSKTTTDFSTLLSIIFTLLFITAAILLEGNINAFFDLPSVLIVVLGTYSIIVGCYSFGDVAKSFKVAVKTIFYNAEDPSFSAMTSLSVAEYAYKKTILSLEHYDEIETDNEIFIKGISLVIDNMKTETIEKILYNNMNAYLAREERTIELIRKAADVSPAMGLIGTLIGLVQMLGSLNDVAKIGPAMAVALLTTFYGAILAYVIFFPLANKLERNLENDNFTMQIYYLAILSISRKENPRQLEIMINNILPENKKVKYFD